MSVHACCAPPERGRSPWQQWPEFIERFEDRSATSFKTGETGSYYGRGGCWVETKGMSRHNLSHRHSGSHHAPRVMITQATMVEPNEPARLPMHSPVLVLNASYEPINICAARRALVLVLKGVAITEEENG